MSKVLRTIAVTIVMTGGIVTTGPSPASAAECQDSPNPPSVGTGDNSLSAIDAVSRCNAWAVGRFEDADGNFQSLILHWDGTAWKRQKTPLPGLRSRLLGVTATSATNAWAVGHYEEAPNIFRSLVVHWNGTAWKRQSTRIVGSDAELTEVDATSSDNAWAVGSFLADTNRQRTLVFRWNGTDWKRQKSPNKGVGHNYLLGVTATSSTNAWAVGRHAVADGWCGGFVPFAGCHSLILHWNGTEWTRQQSPNVTEDFLMGVDATGPDNAWAVGSRFNENDDYETLILRWNGTAWTRQGSPNFGSIGVLENFLYGVSATSSGNAWAVGLYYDSGMEDDTSMILRWNGTAWIGQARPHVGSGDNQLFGVAATSATNAWAVGKYTDDTGEHSLIFRSSGGAWDQ